jgi:hypothetical protein
MATIELSRAEISTVPAPTGAGNHPDLYWDSVS